jgi:hypothetical protein
MAHHSGRDGSIVVDGQKLAKVSSWALTSNVEALDVTSLADVARDYTAGIKSASGSCSIWYYEDAPARLLNKVIRRGEVSDADRVRMRLRWGDHFAEFDALITSGEIACRVGEVMQAQLSFTVCGDLRAVAL